MANNGGKINFQVGFNVDKSGLSQMQSLFQQIANLAQEPANKLNTGLQQAAKTASTLDGILSRTFNTELGTLNVTKFNQELKNSGLTLKTIQADFSRIGTQGANAYNRLAQAVLGTNQQIRQSSKALDSLFTTFKNTVRYGISSSVFNNMANSIQKAFDYSKQLDTSLNDIRIVTDKSAESMADFAKQANEAAKGMGASTLDYTNAALIYYQQGLDDAEVAARAETTIKAANVTGQRGEEVSEQLTAVWNGYKVTAEETELYVDKLAAVAATTAADLEELSVGMSKVASAANAMGVDFDDLNAQIATIVSVTRQAPESVGTALKTIYARLGDLKVDGVDEFGVSLGKVSEQMVQMGIQILDQEGNLRDMSSVIADVAEKWTGWTEAQRQAAAVAMAGKRQYNNLIALFDNWDMYTEALNTSTEAVGTLQHQQDIYMESTAAKLKTLKATWQGLYDDAINEDEVNAGIEALTNLVEVFDNFINSFGGGIKSIAGFGAIVSSIFNKQIADSINSVNQRIQVFKNNLELAQTANNIRMQGASPEGSAAIQANTEAQIQYSQKIYDARLGLNQEQANTLINLQKEIGQTQELLILDENRIKRFEQKSSLEQEDINFIKQYAGDLDEINWKYEGQEELIKEQLDEANKLLQTWEELDKDQRYYVEDLQEAKDLHSQLDRLAEGLNDEEKQAWNILSKKLNTEKDFQAEEEDVLETIRQIIDANKINLSNAQKQTQEARKLSGMYEQMYGNQSKNNSARQQADDMLKAAQSASTLTQQLITVTSALGNMAMAWSSVNSLINTWNNDSIDFGDKLLQTMMTLGMTIPMIYSNYKKLTETFATMNSISAIATANEAAHTAAIEANSVAGAANLIIKQNQELVSQEKVKSILAEITAEETEDIITKKATASEVLYGVAKRTNQGINDNYIQTIEAIILKKHAEEQATKAVAVAQTAAKTASLVFMGVLAALAVTVALVSNHFKELREEASKNAEESLKNAQALTEEYKSNEQLISQYNELYQQYKNGEIQKENLWEVTNKLIDSYDIESARLAALRGDYDSFTNSLNKAKAAREASMKSANQTAFVNAGINVSEQSRGQGFLGINNISLKGDDTLQIGTGNFFRDSSVNAPGQFENTEKIKNLYTEIFETEEKIIQLNRNNPLQVLDFYQKAIEFQNRLNEEGLTASESYERISQIITDLNADGGIDKLLEAQQTGISGLLSSSGLDIASSQEDFDVKKTQLAIDLQQYIPDEKDINEQISSYIATINTQFADQSLIDDFVKNKWGEDFNKSLYEVIKKLDPAIQSELLDKYHFDLTMDEEEGKRKLQEYINYITNSPDGVYSIPFELQSSTNETILKGKDISKSDWEALTESTPNTEEILGTREEFNNKSIGERIALMEQLNQKIQEEAHAHIEAYEAWKQGKAEISNGLQEQIDLINEQIEVQKNRIANATGEEYDKEIVKLHELEDELEDLSNQKYEIDLEIDNYFVDNIDSMLGGMIGEVITQTDQLTMAAESVGKAWTIAADDVQNFASVFPELMDDVNFDWLEDGSIQLTEVGRKLLNDTLENNEQIMNSNKEVVLSAIDDKITQLKADADFQQARIEALEKYLGSELESEANQQELVQSLQESTATYEETLRSNNLVQEGVAQTEKNRIADEGNIGLVEGLKSVDDNVAAVRESYANIFNANYSSSLPGYNHGGVSVSSSYNKATVEEAKKNLTEDTKAFVEEAQRQLEEAKQQLSEDLLQISSYEGAAAEIRKKTNSAQTASNRVQSGQAGKEDKSKSSSSKDKDKELKKLEEEFDRYWEIHKALDQIDRDLKRMDKDQENLYGKELIHSLKQENQLLENQAQLYEQLAAAQQAEAEELRGKLALSGVVFDASGAVVNYAEATVAALKAYNDAVQAYNAGLLDDAAFKIHETAFEEFKKNLERYDTLFYQEMKETQEKLDDIRREILANNLKAWEVEIQFKLDFKQLRRDWNDFINEVTSDFQSVFKDLRVEMKNMLDDAKTYIGKEGTIGTIIDAVHDVTKEIDKMMGGGESDMFESVSQAQEKLKELNEQLLDAGKALHDLYEQAYENLLDGIDQVADKFSKVIDRFERLNEEIEFNGKLIELLYGDEAYGLMSKYYEGMKNNILAQTESLKQQADFWKQEFEQSGASMDDFENWSEEQQKYYDNWMEAQSSLNDMVLEYIQVLKDDYLNTINDILKTLEKNLTGSSLNDVNEEWERISANADKYYDSVEGAYQIQTLANKIDQSIADTNNLKAQQKLMELREREIGYLREKENLTEYDIQAAELRYQLALREIALEDAQQNKTSMKLTRNEQGNWSYQYVADENDVATKRQELLDTYNQLYQLASDAYETNLESLQELQEQYLSSLKEIEELALIDKELAEQRRNELDAWYFEQYGLLADENMLYREELINYGTGLILAAYEQDQSAYTAMTEEQKRLLDELYNMHIEDFADLEEKLSTNYQNIATVAAETMQNTRDDWESKAQEIAEMWNGDGGDSVRSEVEAAYEAIDAATKNYQELVDQCAEIVERDFSEEGIAGAIIRAEEETENLRDKTIEMVQDSHDYLNKLRSYVDEIAEAWRGVQKQIMAAINLIDEYLRKVGEANAAAQQQATIGGASGGGGTGTGGNGGKSPSREPSTTTPQTEQHFVYDTKGNSWGPFSTLEQAQSKAAILQRNFDSKDPSRLPLTVMDTGGYTGSWGNSSGRLAMLHQKELVLNADDTKNFLSGINTIRDLSSSVGGSIQDAVLKAVANTALSLGSIKTNGVLGSIANNNNSTTDNIFNITAEFPNANSVDDIRQAILSLPNLASQYVNSNLR